jgi:hypothetical protein
MDLIITSISHKQKCPRKGSEVFRKRLDLLASPDMRTARRTAPKISMVALGPSPPSPVANSNGNNWVLRHTFFSAAVCN